jgi:VanZ family protein
VNRLVSALLACTILGIACELAQATVVGHHARLADLAPNFVGCLVALLLVVAVRAHASTQRRPRGTAGSSGHGP